MQSCSTSFQAGDERGPAACSRILFEPIKIRSGHFLTVLILVGFNLLCVHLYAGFALLQSEYLTVGQASCPIPCVHVHSPSASHFVAFRKLWLLGVAQPPGITVQRQSLRLQTAPCSSRTGAALWSRAGPGPVLAWADYSMAVQLQVKSTRWLQWLAVSSLV